MSKNSLTGNKGEWSEIYIFFKLLSERKVYAADKNLNKLENVFLNTIRIIREEEKGKEISYYTGDKIKIKVNNKDCFEIENSQIKSYLLKIWNLISTKTGSFTNDEITKFLNSLFITKLKSPATKTNNYFGGTQDITLETEDYRSGVHQIMGFSCKSDLTASATLFNASQDNTNFEYNLIGNINDEVMVEFNNIVNTQGHTDIFSRMTYLHKRNIELNFIAPVNPIAEQNIILACGTEMPSILGEMLYCFYYKNLGKATSISDSLEFIAEKNPANYKFSNLNDVYKFRIQNLLYYMFTGLRMSKLWNGKSDVSGGYIALKNDGDVVAYHTCIADEFKEFLFENLRFESPSCSRHKCMSIYKKDSNYFIKLPLQIRFK